MDIKKKRLIFDMCFFMVLVAIDQITKFTVSVNLKGNPPIVLIKDVLELDYLENKGAAFGMLQNQKILFVFIAVIILGAIIYILKSIPSHKKYMISHVVLVMIAAGAVGNLIDRLMYGYVVDFISFVLIHFPIFNFADICVCVATAVLAVLLLFFYTEEDLNFLSLKTQKFRDLK